LDFDIAVYDGGATRDTYRTFVKVFENHMGIGEVKNESWKANFVPKDNGMAA